MKQVTTTLANKKKRRKGTGYNRKIIEEANLCAKEVCLTITTNKYWIISIPAQQEVCPSNYKTDSSFYC